MIHEHTAPVPPSVTGYNHHGCRCVDCKRMKARYQREYTKRRILNGGQLTVSANLVREHLLWLRDNGVGGQRVAELTGLSMSSMHVWRIMSGKTKRVRRSTARAILAISPSDGSDGNLVDSSLTWLRLRGLMALGYSAKFLAHELGSTRNELPAPAPHTTVKRARQVVELVKTYGGQPGPDERTRRYARNRGWPVIGEFDDDLRELSDRGQSHQRNPHARTA